MLSNKEFGPLNEGSLFVTFLDEPKDLLVGLAGVLSKSVVGVLPYSLPISLDWGAGLFPGFLVGDYSYRYYCWGWYLLIISWIPWYFSRELDWTKELKKYIDRKWIDLL